MEGDFNVLFSQEKHGFLNKSVYWGDSLPTYTISILLGLKDLICVSKRWLAAVEKMHQKSCNFKFCCFCSMGLETVFLSEAVSENTSVSQNICNKYLG